MKTNLNKVTRIGACVSFLILVFVLACLSEQEKAVLGVWKGVEEGERIELLKDGTFIQVDENTTKKGKYEFVDEGKIKVVPTALGLASKPFVVNVSIHDNELTWSVLGSEGKKYHR